MSETATAERPERYVRALPCMQCGHRRYRVLAEDDHSLLLACADCDWETVYSVHSPYLRPDGGDA